MKKIFFILAFFVININVNALTVTRGNLDRNICSNDGEIYPMYFANIQGRETYLLKPSKSKGVDTDKYYNIPFESTSFPNELRDYYFAFIYFEKYFSNSQIYHALTQRLIWDYLYPEKEYKFCRDDKTIYSFHEEEYQNVKEMMQSVIAGPDLFNKENVQISNLTKEYKFTYFSKYYIFDNDNLDAYIDNDTLYVKGKPGKYTIKFKKNEIKYPLYLFNNMMTDGENYLFSTHSQNDVTYEMNVKIIDNNVSVSLYDNDKILYDECIYYNDEKYCSNENGIINISNIKNDEYNLIYKESDKYMGKIITNKLSETNDTIKINLIRKHNNDLSKNETNEDNFYDDNTSYEKEITFENTLAISYIPFIIILLVFGAIFVKKKKS